MGKLMDGVRQGEFSARALTCGLGSRVIRTGCISVWKSLLFTWRARALGPLTLLPHNPPSEVVSVRAVLGL